MNTEDLRNALAKAIHDLQCDYDDWVPGDADQYPYSAYVNALLTPEALRHISEIEGGPSASPEDTCKVGDPDPTPNVGPYCLAVRGPFTCTRHPQHSGQHLAGAGNSVAATWPAVDPHQPAEDATVYEPPMLLPEETLRHRAQRLADELRHLADRAEEIADELEGLL